MSLTVPTWISAIATVGLLVGAAVTAVFAVKAFGKQSAQLKDQQEINRKQTLVLDLQSRELDASVTARREATMQLRQEFASTVVAWQDEPQAASAGWLVVAHVLNTGQRPVRDVSVRWYAGGEPIRAREEITACFLPGHQKNFDCRVDGASILAGLKAIVQFRTVGNDWWSAGTDGGLVGGLDLADASERPASQEAPDRE
jgi:hypothetical protein